MRTQETKIQKASNARTKRAFVWKYFSEKEKDPSKAICNVEKCNTEISRGGKNPAKFTNSNLKSHLASNHPDIAKLVEEN